jgi:hypothetical protein
MALLLAGGLALVLEQGLAGRVQLLGLLAVLAAKIMAVAEELAALIVELVFQVEQAELAVGRLNVLVLVEEDLLGIQVTAETALLLQVQLLVLLLEEMVLEAAVVEAEQVLMFGIAVTAGSALLVIQQAELAVVALVCMDRVQMALVAFRRNSIRIKGKNPLLAALAEPVVAGILQLETIQKVAMAVLAEVELVVLDITAPMVVWAELVLYELCGD